MAYACLYSEWRNLLPSSVHIQMYTYVYAAQRLYSEFMCMCYFSYFFSISLFCKHSFASRVFWSTFGSRGQTCMRQNIAYASVSFSEFPFWLHFSPNFGSSSKQRPISLFCVNFCQKILLGSTEGQLKRNEHDFIKHVKLCHSILLDGCLFCGHCQPWWTLQRNTLAFIEHFA